MCNPPKNQQLNVKNTNKYQYTVVHGEDDNIINIDQIKEFVKENKHFKPKYIKNNQHRLENWIYSNEILDIISNM